MKKEDQLSGNIPFVMAGITNTGVINYISNPVASFPKNSITVDIFGNTFYRDYDFGAGDDTGVYWNDNVEYSKDAMLFFAVAMQKALLGRFSYGKKLRSSQSLKFKMMLPVKNDKIDFEFISSFIKELEAERIKELEAERIKELEAYLKVVGFDSYELTKEEADSLVIIETRNVLWRGFKMEELFEKISTIKLPYKAKELPEEAIDNFVLPCLTSSFKNQGLNYYVPKDGATILKDVISIPSNSDVYRAYFQSNEFTVLSDAYAIRWKDKSMHISQNQYLFMVMCINKFTDLPIYSYKNKLGGWNAVKNKSVLLPVKKNKIDFDFMETFINAIKKLTLRNVADYADKRIAATKEVIQNKKENSTETINNNSTSNDENYNKKGI